MNDSRQYTAEEVRQKFFEHLMGLVKFWDRVDDRSAKGKMYGLIHSLLVTFDGMSGDMPGFLIYPRCHSSDPEYHKDNGDNWYPTNDDAEMECEISCGDMLHDAWGNFCRLYKLDMD